MNKHETKANKCPIGFTETSTNAEPLISRREMLRKSLTLSFVGAICLLDRTVAAKTLENFETMPKSYELNTVGQTKPLLTAKNINRLISAVRKNPKKVKNKTLVSKATLDWREFIKSEFRLTSAQRRNLDALASESVAEIQKVVNQAAKENIRLAVSAVPRGKEQQVSPTGTESKPRLNISGGGHVDCTFDDDCGDVKCELKPGLPANLPPKPGDQ